MEPLSTKCRYRSKAYFQSELVRVELNGNAIGHCKTGRKVKAEADLRPVL